MISKKNIKFGFNRIYTMLYSVFHPVEKKIIFESFRGKQYSGNPRAISEMMHVKFPEYKIVWALNSAEDPYHILPDYIHIVPCFGKAYYQQLATSFCHVSNEAFETNIFKRKGQYNVQTWHGDRGFKNILYDAWEGGKRPTPVIDNKVTDVCVAASTFGESVYRSAFRYNGKILTVGSPRNDKLINKSADVVTIKKSIGVDSNFKVLLYAPTFRDQNKNKQESIDISRTLDVLEINGEKWVCIIRAHPASKGINYSNDNTKIIDVTNYPDMADLLCVTDLLITDYSSVACDAVTAGIPTILAIFDSEDYIKNNRKLKVVPEKAGFIVAYNQHSLEKVLVDSSINDYREESNKVDKFYGTCETGKASEQVCKLINDNYIFMHSDHKETVL